MATIGAAARRLGKVSRPELRELSGALALCLLSHTPMGGGDRDVWEGVRDMFGLQISQNIAYDPWWGVRGGEKKLPL